MSPSKIPKTNLDASRSSSHLWNSTTINSISGQVEGGGYLGTTDGMDFKAISLLVRFPSLYKEHFADILPNRFYINPYLYSQATFFVYY